MERKSSLFAHVRYDLPAGLVVFLVALPLCLGVAVASGASPFAGIIAGVIGGLVVGALSQSPLSVSGPAAGLTSIVALAIENLGQYEIFLMAVVLAGVMQLLMGYLKAGVIGNFIPNAVIKGMLAAIGIILILKQIPHFFGYDADPEGDEAFMQPDHSNTFSEIFSALEHITPMAVVAGALGLIILMVYEIKAVKNAPLSRFLPGPLAVVVSGIFINALANRFNPGSAISESHLVGLPVFNSASDVFGEIRLPDWTAIASPDMWTVAVTIAIVASIESLLSLEAVDDLDEQKRISSPNRELVAQGAGNIVSGLLGGLPVTSVIVRSSANVNAGAKSKLSTIVHGVLLLASVLLFSKVFNLIPLASLAAILIFTGYKLAKISLFKEYYRKGWGQFLPFIVTVLAIVFTDLLKGVAVGLLLGVFFIIRSNFRTAVSVIKDDYRYLIRFKKEVTFLNKSLVKTTFARIPDETAVLLDATRADFVDQDIVDLVNDFIIHAPTRGIRVYLKRRNGKEEIFNDITQNVFRD